MNSEAYERLEQAAGEIRASQERIAEVPATSCHWPESAGITDFAVAQGRVCNKRKRNLIFLKHFSCF